MKTIAQNNYVQVAVWEIKKANERTARLDSALAQGKILMNDFKLTQDSLRQANSLATNWKGKSIYWEAEAKKFKKQRNKWAGVALFEAVLIGLGLKSKISQ